MDDVFSNFDLVLSGFWLTTQLLLISMLISLTFGTVLAAARVGPVPVLSWGASIYVSVIRNTPLLMIFAIVFIAMPRLDINFPFLIKGCIALSVYTSAFVCEAMRSGVNAVSLGQAEASRAIGLTFVQSMRYVVLPQALRAVVPPLASVQIALVKNTSIGAAFGLAEATFRMKGFTNNNAGDKPLIFITFAIGYILIVEVISAGAFGLERRWKVAR